MNPSHYQAIAALDLEPIKVKLMHRESGEGWSLARADAVEFEYRRFLILMKQFPAEQVAPLVDVDTFWHYHILDTMKYAADCEQVFGYFLHHFPYVGLRGEEDEALHATVGERMKQLYEATFGEAYVRTTAPAPSADGAGGQAAWSVVVPVDAAPAQAAWSVVVPVDDAVAAQALAAIGNARQSSFDSLRPRLAI